MASQPDLTNVAISSGYATLIHTEESGGVSTSYTNLYDGDGTLIPMAFATTGVKIIDGSYDFDIASHDGSNGLKLGGTLVTTSATELNLLDGITAGTVSASKFLLVDSNKDLTGLRNLTGTGTAQFANFTATGDTTIGDSVASDSVAFNSTITTNLVFEGSTANAYETTLAITDPTADRTWTIPDATDTSVGRATTDTLTNKTLTAPDINTPDIDGGTVDAITSLTVANNVDIGSYDLRAGTLTADGLTSGRVVFAGTNGVLSDDSDLSFSGATLSATNMTSSGTVTYGSLSDGSITITAFVDEDGMDSDSATLVPTQQSVKAYVDAQVTAQDLDFQGDSGGALNIDLDSETLDIAGGTGIDTSGSSNTLTVAIDSTVATLAGSQTLSNKTLASPVITTQFNIGSATITEAELEILDGASTTTSELNIIDGDTTATSTTLADADRVVVNDNGTMVQVALTDFETYFESALDTLSNVTTVGTLNSGAISSGFSNIDIGSSNLTATGTVSLGATSFNDNNITNVGDINVDSVSSDDGSGFDLILDDNKTTALEIKEGSTAYLTFVTTDSGEKITLGKKLEAGSVEIEGSAFDINGGTIDGVTMATSDITVGSGKTLDVSAGTLTLADNQISGNKVEGGTIASTTITALTTAGITASANLDIGAYTLRASNFLADSQTATQVAFYGTDGLLAGDSDMTFSGSTLTVTDLTVSGTLTTTGSAQEVSTTNLNVQDPLILLNKYDSQPSNNAFDAGIVIKRGSSDSTPENVAIIWDESANTFSLVDTDEDGTTAGNITITDYENLRVGALTADDASTFTSTISTASGSTIGNLTLANGSITDSGGAISFGNENLSTTGTLSAGAITGTSFVIGSADIGEAELEILDGATVTTAELNLIDGGTARGTTAVASGDGILINDGGTMRMTNVDTVSTYFASHNVGGSNIVTTGALNSGSITSGFGTIDTGSSNITTTGVGSFGSLDISGNVDIDGTFTVGTDGSGQDVTFYSGTSGDSFVWDSSAEKLTITGTNGQTALDIADGNLVVADNIDLEGDIDVNGTANLDVVDIDGAVDMASTLAVGDVLTVDKSISAGDLNTAPIVTFKNSQGSGHYTAIKFEGADDSGANTGFLGYMSHNTSATRRFVFSHDGTTRDVAINGDGSTIFAGDVSLTKDGARLFVNSADYELVSIGRAGSSGSSLDQGYFRMKSAGSNKVAFHTAGDSYITGGSLGIGTASPSAKLDISGDTSSWAGMAKIYLTDVNSNSSSRNWSIGNGGTAYGALSFIVSNAEDGVPADSTGTAVMSMDGVNKRVGIGTTSPARALHLSTADNQIARFESTDAYAEIELKDNGTGANPPVIGVVTDDMYFNTNNAERMRITSGGAVGVGVTSPNGNMEIDGSNGAQLDLANVKTSAGGTDPLGVLRFRSYDGSTNRSGVLAYIQSLINRPNLTHTTNIDGSAFESSSLEFYTAMDFSGSTAMTSNRSMRIKGNGQVEIAHTGTSFAGDDYNALWVNTRKTQNDSDSSSNYRGGYFNTWFADADQTFGSMYGIHNTTRLESAGSAEMVQITGIDNSIQMEDGDVNYMRGMTNFVNFDGGIIDNNIQTLYNLTEIASGGTISGSVYAIENDYDADTNPSGVMYGYYGVGRSNHDYHILTYSTTVSSVTFRLGDNGSIEHEQGISSNQSLDYAEYFESKDGKSIAIGTTVKLDDGKIVACEDGDTPIGVVRPVNTSAVVGGKQAFHWQGMYETDDYGGYVMESFTMTKWEKEVDVDTYLKTKENDGGVLGGSIKKEHYDKDKEKKYIIKYKFHTDRIPSDLTVPSDARIVEDKNKRKKINSDYDHSKADSYKDREERDEWHIVGLLGQIQITKGQPLASNWIKMKDVSDTVELYFVK